MSNTIINPILIFKRGPTPEGVTGRGKTEDKIKQHPENQRGKLASQIKDISKRIPKNLVFANTTHLIAKMQADSHSPSWTPTDIFTKSNGCEIVAPAYEGFLVEIQTDKLEQLALKISNTSKPSEKVDISRLESVELFDDNETLRGKSIESMWTDTNDSKFQAFNIWLKPFKNTLSRTALIKSLVNAIAHTDSRIGDPEFSTDESAVLLNKIFTNYLELGYGSLSLEIKGRASLEKILNSGAIYRIEPSINLATTSNPGSGQDPSPRAINPESPVVVIIDGGVTAASYMPLQKATITPLVNSTYANNIHGNKVVSLVCQAHAWNNNRPLPELDCTFISAQAICKESAPKSPTSSQLMDYLRKVAEETSGISKVWNLSFNQLVGSVEAAEVSYLGHQINKLAREFDFLPVISAGNTNHNSASKAISPPADCESALTVGGRDFGSIDTPLGETSRYSLIGPGPAGMKKPDLSWYGTLRMLGGVIDEGTSFSTPLVSSLAAHAFDNLKLATPDLIRALLINKADQGEHHHGLGWGTPALGNTLPWFCPDGSVTLAWTSKLKPGFSYYWDEIPIPSELIKNGKLKGTVALTAILKPITSELGGDNYFATRLQTSLQAKSKKDKTISLAGSMKESSESEMAARDELAKWSPIRNHVKLHKRGTAFKEKSVRLYARVFTRDLFQFDVNHHSDLDEQEVAFVLTFKASEDAPNLYNSMLNLMGQDVESGVIEQHLQIEKNLTS